MSKPYSKADKAYWRSLEQLAESTDSGKQLAQRHSDNDPEANNIWTRRSFMTLMGASLALAGLSGCRRPKQKIVPYVTQPEEVLIGAPQYYATTIPRGDSACGLIVESHEGRPTKVEGNPLHSSSLGATDFLIQASILSLYDPDRSKSVMHKGVEKDYDDFVSFWGTLSSEVESNGGTGLTVLAEPFSSPTLARLKTAFLKSFPKAGWVTYEPLSNEHIYSAVRNVSGRKLRPLYHFDKADIILSLDSDFLQTESENIAASRGFADGRRMTDKDADMNRLYVAENAFSITGSMADHRIRIRSGDIGRFTIALAALLKSKGLNLGTVPEIDASVFDNKWLTVLAEDILKSKGRSLIVAGCRQPTWVHELVLVLNEALGNVGATIEFRDMPDSSTAGRDELMNLSSEMMAGRINTLIMIGGNPIYNAPVDAGFKAALKKVEHSIHLSDYFDETSGQVEWHIPRSHFLESWGDARAVDGTLSVIQPMIEPLFGGKSDVELLSLFGSGRDQRGYDLVRDTWDEILKKSDVEKKWRKVLHDGTLEDSSLSTIEFGFKKSVAQILGGVDLSGKGASADGLEIGFYSSNVHDGRFANNAWLQELPDVVTKLAWDNAALISPRTAQELGLVNGDGVNIDFDGRSLEMPIWISPGNADYSLSLPLGYGRTAGGRVADNVGFDTYTLRTSEAVNFGAGGRLSRTGKKYDLANTQDHNLMEGRPIVREATLDEYRKHPTFVREMVEHPQLYPDYDYSKGYQWGMVIDLNTCTGCNACVIACQSENNIPVVGKQQVANGREMHWIRNDRYYVGNAETPEMVFQPVPCQQCENAPCEQVCPVAATVHDREGLNTMNYNRCIGTRYCSNNCPYKVRRFNFFNYINEMPEVVKMAQNPDVTVRSRGVMEKCTFCIQRINRSKKTAKKENRRLSDGEIITACQQACPTNAIHFGNINDTESRVAGLKKTDRNYDLLEELNTRPRNSYLAKLRNPNPALEGYKPKTG